MSPKIKMRDIHDERDDDIIELSDEELKEILADNDFDDSEEYGEIHSFVFSNPDPYAKVKPRPDDAPKRELTFDEKGNRKNHSTLLQTVRRGHQRRKEKWQGGSVELHSASRVTM